MERPASKGDLDSKDEPLPFARSCKVLIGPLGSKQVCRDNTDAREEAEATSPPDNRVPDEVVLGLIIPPAAHPEAEVKPRPVERFGREDVLLVWVRDKSVVGRHHGDVEVPKVGKERRAVELGLALGDWNRTERC